MSTKYEQIVIAQYLLNILKGKHPQSKPAQYIVQWAEMNGQNFAGEITIDSLSKQEDKVQSVISKLEKIVRSHRNKRTDILDINIHKLCKVLKCDDVDIKILTLAARLKSCTNLWGLLCQMIREPSENALELIALMIDCRGETINERLSINSKLCQNNIVYEGDFSSSNTGQLDRIINLNRFVYRALIAPHKKDDFLYNCLIGKPEKPSLTWDDFSHIKETREFIARLLKNALKKRQTGINILLYGIPGTGKTEFCKTIASHLNLPLYSIAQKGRYGLNREDRIGQLCLANTLLAKNRGALLLFDEMEDMLSANLLTGNSNRGGAEGSKVFVNRMFESNALPTFWTANDISRCDPAILRRMTLAIEMQAPPRHSRKIVLKKMLDQEKLHLSENEIHSLAHEYDDAPALIKNAVRAASLAGGKTEQIQFVLQNSRKSMGQKKVSRQGSESKLSFTPELINTELDLTLLTKQLTRKKGPRNFSLCLYGPPGTGKSAYVRYLGEKLEMEVMHIRASDLISKWVGETEKKIAEAFEKSITDEAFLLFDEADSFLHDRQLSRNSWEVTAVNEMLTWMESHPLPFACTTNLMERLDAASLRRFTFKMGFDYMMPEQIISCFKHFFSQEPPPEIRVLNRLTPGDFAVVRRKAEIIGQSHDSRALLSMLYQEQDAKPGGSKPIGFMAGL